MLNRIKSKLDEDKNSLLSDLRETKEKLNSFKVARINTELTSLLNNSEIDQIQKEYEELMKKSQEIPLKLNEMRTQN